MSTRHDSAEPSGTGPTGSNTGSTAEAGRTGTAAPGAVPPAQHIRNGPRARLVWITGVLATLLLAGFVSYYASASPDGLEKVAADHGIDEKAEEHAAKDSPLADYQVRDIGSARLSGGLAGVVGVGATLAVGTGVFWVVRRRTAGEPAGGAGSAGSAGVQEGPR